MGTGFFGSKDLVGFAPSGRPNFGGLIGPRDISQVYKPRQEGSLIATCNGLTSGR